MTICGCEINHIHPQCNVSDYALHSICSSSDLINFKICYVKWLVENGANILHKGRDGYGMLYLAAFRGNYELVEYLLSREESKQLINELTFNDPIKTPLITACMMRMEKNADIAILLIEHGAIVDKVVLDIIIYNIEHYKYMYNISDIELDKWVFLKSIIEFKLIKQNPMKFIALRELG